MKLSLAFASTFGMLLSQSQGVSAAVALMASVVVDGDGCDNLDCGSACYDLSHSAKTELAKISQGKRGDTTKVPSGEFWTIGVCNPGGQCVPDVRAVAADCDDPVNDATVYLATSGPTLGPPLLFGANPDTPATGFISPDTIIGDLRKRAVKAFGKLLGAGTSEEIVDAATEAFQSLVVTTTASIYGGCWYHTCQCVDGQCQQGFCCECPDPSDC